MLGRGGRERVEKVRETEREANRMTDKQGQTESVRQTIANREILSGKDRER